MDLVDAIFSKIGLSKDEWLLDIDDYEQKELISKDKMISIYKTKEKKNNIFYTAKIYNIKMNKYLKFEETDIPRILQISSQLTHFSILQLKGFSPINFKHQMVNYQISRYDILTPTQKLNIIYGIASGMKYIHSQDIIHCQLQTSSIYLDSNFYPKISQFSHSQKVSEIQQNAKYDFEIEPSFVAPEVWERKGCTKSSDVYSFGMIVYEIVSNEKPQQKSKNLTKIMNDVANKGYRPKMYQSAIKILLGHAGQITQKKGHHLWISLNNLKIIASLYQII